MKAETRDRELMIGALYAELSPDEEQEFQGLLAADSSLRAEFEELRDTRNVLEDWDVAAPASGFVFVDPVSDTVRQREPDGRWARIAGWFSMPIPSWGFAVASVAMAVLILTGFRVDWLDNGVAFRFGPEARQAVSQGQMAGGGPLEQIPADNVLQPVAMGAVTRDDLNLYSGNVVRIMSTMLDDYQEKRNAEMAYILQRFYEEMRFERQREFEDLRTRVEGMGLGLMAEQSMTNAALQGLIQERNQEAVPLNPYDGSPLNQNEDKQND